MDRQQAMTLLKELVENNLVDPSYVSIFKIKPNDFQVQIKCDYEKTELESYAKIRGLTIQEDKERKYLVIFKQ